MNTINPLLVEMKYAVRGLVPTTAGEIAKDLKQNPDKYPFDEILYCNIGNPQSVGQKPVTWYRDILSLVDAPHLLMKKDIGKIYSKDVINRAKDILKHLPNGTGAYTHSLGAAPFKKSVAKFIEQRDGVNCDPEKIILTNGASSGIDLALTTIIADPTVGVLIPIPQYPIYSAIIKIKDGKQIPYVLHEQDNWSINVSDLVTAVHKAKKEGINPRAMVIINPGNPTGNVFSKSKLLEIIKFCQENSLILLSDEVYQDNVYSTEKEFHSIKKLVNSLGPEFAENFEYISFHSTSKGLIGECGRRGGYMEICGFDEEVFQQITKLQSSRLCSNVDGQVMTSLMCSPPTSVEESYQLYEKQRQDIYNAFKRKSKFLYQKLNSIEGITCQPLEGAMYAFPKIDMPAKAIEEAKKEGVSVDVKYCLSLLRETGICCVPGSGFGQEEGTYHLRMTFLPEEDKLKTAMVAFEKHHISFMAKYQQQSNI